MTNNQLTLEQAIQHTDEKAAALSGPCAEQHKQLAEWLRELQERRKAAMDSEPVAYMWDSKRKDIDAPGFYFPEHLFFAESNAKHWGGEVISLYRHAQQPVVQPVMFIDGDISSEDADKLAKVIRGFNEEDERPLAKMARTIRENPHPTNECDMPRAQPAPVVMDDTKLRELFDSWFASDCSFDLSPEASEADNIAWRESYWYVWQRCRTAMLQAGTLTNEDTKQAGNSPVIPEGYVMVPKEPTEAMMLHNSGCQHHAWDDPDCAMRQTRRLVWSHMLAAAQQEVK